MTIWTRENAGEGALAAMEQDLGKPYIFGGNLPPIGSDGGTDCSGLYENGYDKVGIAPAKITRVTYTQENIARVTIGAAPADADGLFFEGADPGPQGEAGHVGAYKGIGTISGVGQHIFTASKSGKPVMINAPFTGDVGGIRYDYFSWSMVVAHCRPANLYPSLPTPPPLPAPTHKEPSAAQLEQCKLVKMANPTQAGQAKKNGRTLWYFGADGHFHPQVNGKPTGYDLFAATNWRTPAKIELVHLTGVFQ